MPQLSLVAARHERTPAGPVSLCLRATDAGGASARRVVRAVLPRHPWMARDSPPSSRSLFTSLRRMHHHPRDKRPGRTDGRNKINRDDCSLHRVHSSVAPVSTRSPQSTHSDPSSPLTPNTFPDRLIHLAEADIQGHCLLVWRQRYREPATRGKTTNHTTKT